MYQRQQKNVTSKGVRKNAVNCSVYSVMKFDRSLSLTSVSLHSGNDACREKELLYWRNYFKL